MMHLLTSPEAWAALLTLTALEIVLGIDNVIFLSVIVSRIPPAQAEPRAEDRPGACSHLPDRPAQCAGLVDWLDRTRFQRERGRILVARYYPDRWRPVPDRQGDP